MKKKILLIEDDLDMQTLIIHYLENYDFSVQAYDKPLEALTHLESNKNSYDLIILDLMLPQMDGFDVCKKIREMSNIPIIISSAKHEIDDKILTYDLGADDYLSKPYEPRELVIRINAILRRATNNNKVIGDFELNEDKMEISFDGYLLDLTKIEYEILHLFLSNNNKVLSREVIANAINAFDYNPKDRAIDMHVSNLRAKLGDDSKNAQYIKSVWGIGYKFIG